MPRPSEMCHAMWQCMSQAPVNDVRKGRVWYKVTEHTWVVGLEGDGQPATTVASSSVTARWVGPVQSLAAGKGGSSLAKDCILVSTYSRRK